MKRTVAVLLGVLIAQLGGWSAHALEPHIAQSGRLFCGEMCAQMNIYGDADFGAWFINGQDELVMAGNREIRVVNTVSQKETRHFTADKNTWFEDVAISQNDRWIVVSISDGRIVRFDTADWTQSAVVQISASSIVGFSAISNDGESVYLGFPFESGTIQSFCRYRAGRCDSGGQWSEKLDYGNFALDASGDNLYLARQSSTSPFYRYDGASPGWPIATSETWAFRWGNSLAIAQDGTVYGGFSESYISLSPMASIWVMDGESLEAKNKIQVEGDFAVNALALSTNDEILYASLQFPPTSPAAPRGYTIRGYDTNTLESVGSVVLPERAFPNRASSLDIDETGRYLVANTSTSTWIVTLDDSPPTIQSTYGGSGAGQWVEWEYIYLNSNAKFKQFEVQYTPLGSAKAVVKKVTNARATTIGATAVGSDILVRAVYTSKSYTTGWFEAVPAP